MDEGKYTVRAVTVQADATQRNLLPADPERVAVYFTTNSGFSSAFAIAVGWGVTQPYFPIVSSGYTLVKHSDSGPLCAGAWDCINPTGTTQIWATEIVLVKG